MSSLVTASERSVGGKVTRSGLETRTSRPAASTFTASDLAMRSAKHLQVELVTVVGDAAGPVALLVAGQALVEVAAVVGGGDAEVEPALAVGAGALDQGVDQQVDRAKLAALLGRSDVLGVIEDRRAVDDDARGVLDDVERDLVRKAARQQRELLGAVRRGRAVPGKRRLLDRHEGAEVVARSRLQPAFSGPLQRSLAALAVGRRPCEIDGGRQIPSHQPR